MLTISSAIHRPPGIGTWHYVPVPADTATLFGSRSQVRVQGTLNGVAFQSTLLPDGQGGHYLVVGGDLRDAAGVGVGDSVQLTLAKDETPPTVLLDPELAAALEGAPAAKAAFERLSYSRQKEQNRAVAEAKRSETKAKRIERILADLNP